MNITMNSSLVKIKNYNNFPFRIICFLICIFIACPVFAHSEKKRELVDELLEKSGILVQVEQYTNIIEAGIGQKLMQSPGMQNNPMISSLKASKDKAFEKSTIKSNVRSQVKQNLSESNMKKVITWLDSPLGKKITEMEKAASSPSAVQEMMTVAKKLALDVNRVSIMKRLDKATKQTDMAVEMMINSQLLAMSTLSSISQPGTPVSVNKMMGQLKKSSAQMRGVAEQQVVAAFLYAYRDLSEADLNKYIGFAESPYAVKYHEVTTTAITQQFLIGLRKFANDIGKQLNP